MSAVGTGLKLRDYQDQSVRAIVGAWQRGMRRPAIVLPTGTGKTVVFSALGRMVNEAGGRFGVLAHRDELISQAVGKIHDVAPGTRVGVYQGDRREIRGVDAVVCSLGSLTRAARREELKAAGLSALIVDECHHAVSPTYRKVLEDLGAYADREDPAGIYAAGVTATMVRGDGVALGHVWEDVVHREDIADMVRRGYLAPAVGLRVRLAGLDLSRVSRSAGDFQKGALGRAMEDALAPQAIARAVSERAADRVGVVFTPSVSFAHAQAEALVAAGMTAVALDGTTDIEVRRAALRDFRAGKIQWLVNCGLFTEGTDLPMITCVVVARPTSSVGLYMQMAGRGLRTWPGKQDCLIMDVVGNTGRYKLASFSVLSGGELVMDLDEADREEMDRLAEELGLLGLEEELSRRAREEAGEEAIGGADGPLEYEEVSLFEQSHQQWLRTNRGVWFLAAGKEIIALAPADSMGEKWSVMAVPVGAAGGRWVVESVDMSYAMAYGEAECDRIEERLPYGTRKSAGWRRAAVSDAQRMLARRMGLVIPDGARAGEVSGLIDTVQASRRLDHLPIFAGVGA